MAARRRSHRCCGASAASYTAPLPSNRHHSGCPATTPTGRIGPPGAKANAVISGILPHCACSTLGCVLNGSQHEGASLVILVHSRLILLAKPRQSLWQSFRSKGLGSGTSILERARDLPSPTLGRTVESGCYEIDLAELLAQAVLSERVRQIMRSI